jgi:hypothetical protein
MGSQNQHGAFATAAKEIKNKLAKITTTFKENTTVLKSTIELHVLFGEHTNLELLFKEMAQHIYFLALLEGSFFSCILIKNGV